MNEAGKRLQQRADGRETPLLRLQARSGLPAMAFGAISGALVAAALLLPVALVPVGQETFMDVVGSALFFGVSIAMLAGFSRSVFKGASGDLLALKPVLPWSDEDVDTAGRALSRESVGQIRLLLAIGLGAGVLHTLLMGYLQTPPLFALPQAAATILLWITMMLTVPLLISNARLFSELGQIATPDLLRPTRHSAFGAAALRPAMLIIGLLCAYVLLFIGDDNPLDGATLIGAVVSIVALLGIVTLPLRGIRRRIREQRSATLQALDQRLDTLTSCDIATADADSLFQLDAVLDMRERVARAPGWPFDVSALKRIVLYTILPPLTWAAAAVVEILVNSVL